MALIEAEWLAQLPEEVREPAPALLDQVTAVAEIIAASLATCSAEQTVRNLESARPRARQVLHDAGQHLDMQAVGELVGERVRVRHGDAQGSQIMDTFVTLVADRADDGPAL